MEVIRDYNQLKLLDKNVSYACVGFTRSNLFNFTHEHLYNYTKNKADKLIGFLWDNEYDIKYFINDPIPPSLFDENEAINWYETKGFDYLFIPDFSLIATLLGLPEFQGILTLIDGIMAEENYERFLGKDFNPGNKQWIRLVLARHYFFYSNQNPNKIINRTYQAVAPDGTWGFIFKNFWEKYCGCESPMVPILRNENGLAFDLPMERLYPIEIINIFVSMLPSFNLFSSHRDIEKLKLDLTEDLAKAAPKETSQNYFFYSLDYFCDEIITQNKYILKLQIRGKYPKTYNTAGYDLYRLWEYDPTL